MKLSDIKIKIDEDLKTGIEEVNKKIAIQNILYFIIIVLVIVSITLNLIRWKESKDLLKKNTRAYKESSRAYKENTKAYNDLLFIVREKESQKGK